MTKTYHNKGKIHPSPPPSAAALLPATILTLAACLSPAEREGQAEREVLSYLLTPNKSSPSSGGSHRPEPHCGCFECYTSYWARWDTSPNRHVIDEVLEAYEDEMAAKKKKRKNKKKNYKRGSELYESCASDPVDSGESVSRVGDSEKGAVGKIVGFIGQRIWGVWGK